MMKQKFLIVGMTCASCQVHVQKAVEKLDGVLNVNVNLLNNSMVVEFDENKLKNTQIIQSVSKAGYKASLFNIKQEKKKNISLIKLIISALFLLLLLYISMSKMLSLPLPFFLSGPSNALWFSLTQCILVLPIIIIYFSYFTSGFKKLCKLKPNMDSLIALSSSAAFLYGVFSVFMIGFALNRNDFDTVNRYKENLFFESSGMILVLISFGKYLEDISKRKTTNAITDLLALVPKKANVMINDIVKEVLIEEVQEGDIIVVKKGDSVPVDGIIIDGEGFFDQASITGESIAVFKKKDEEVFSSTILISGYIVIKATKVGKDSSINVIISLVEEAANSKAPISRLVDKISRIFVPIVLLISILVLMIFLSCGYGFELSFNFAITTLVIACPCSLGLATPVAIMVGVGKAAKHGLIIKNAEILEKSGHIKTLILDKTGTLTIGKPRVVDFRFFDIDEQEIINVIYSLEKKSEHPLAEALTMYLLERNAQELSVNDYEAIEGEGIRGTINNEQYYIGNLKIIDDIGVKISEDYIELINEYGREGKTTLIISNCFKVIGLVSLKDTIKENAKETISQLKQKGIHVVMLTGDNEMVADATAKELEINEVYANIYPKDKMKIVESYKKESKHLIAMVGDGVNDAPALATADIGIAIGGGSSIAIKTSDIVLLSNSLMDIDNVISLSKRILLTIKINLFWAFFYNCIGIILAAGVFYPSFGLKLNPMIAALAMSISSLFVVLNALTINLFKTKKRKEKRIMFETEIKVHGMMCEHCKKHVEDALMAIDGVNEVKVNLKSGRVIIKTVKEINKEIYTAKILDIGYKAE